MRLFIAFCVVGILACGSRQTQDSRTNEHQQMTTPSASASKNEAPRKYILFFGNSLTAGYGLDEDQSFPSLIQNKIDSLGLPYQAINGGLSGETSAGGLNRIDWVLRQPIDVFMLELGPNDALRGFDKIMPIILPRLLV